MKDDEYVKFVAMIDGVVMQAIKALGGWDLIKPSELF